MALILKPKKPAAAPEAEGKAPTEEHPTTMTHATTKSTMTNSSPSMGFIKKGAQAKAVMAQEDKKVEERKKEMEKGKLYRFWLPEGKDGSFTFLDGNMADDILDIPFLYEHNVYMNGNWKNWFICTQDTEPCPICEGGGKPYYAGFFTVIDHSEWTDKQGVKHRDEVKMFVAKRDTIKQLLKLSAKRGGLRGCRFDVSRTGDKSPSVGNVFDFVQKYSEQELSQMYGQKSKPLDFNTILTEAYMDAKELRKLGFGSLSAPVGSEPGAGDTDYSNDL